MPVDIVSISIVVPVFNAADYLNETVGSILSQSFSDFELLLINDGSTDDSKSICEAFQKNDQRVRLVDKPNGGVSSARNEGIKISKGAYILHVDADDLLLQNALLKLYQNAISTQADIVVADYIVRHGYGEKSIKQEQVDSATEFLTGMLNGEYHAGLWNKLISKDCYNALSFDEQINCMEDKLILTQMLLRDPSISFLNFEVYVYIQRDASITNNLTNKSIASYASVIKKIDHMLKGRDTFDKLLIKMKLNYKVFLLRNSSERKNLIRAFSEVNKGVLFSNLIPFRFRLLLWFEIHNVSVFTKSYKFIKRWSTCRF